jgi:hypothetical protein
MNMPRYLTSLLATCAFFASLVGNVSAAPPPSPGQEEKPACHGTALTFMSTPKEAAEMARKEKKLVFVLHVSGYFEDPDFT